MFFAGFDRCRSEVNPCDTNAHCMDPFNLIQITCTCFVGYTGDGVTCSGIKNILFSSKHIIRMYVLDINECTEGTAQCPSHSTCGNTIGSFVCNCDSGFRKVADMCEGNRSSWSLFKSYCILILLYMQTLMSVLLGMPAVLM